MKTLLEKLPKILPFVDELAELLDAISDAIAIESERQRSISPDELQRITSAAQALILAVAARHKRASKP